MSKRSFITNITPLPPTITRTVALAYLHDHLEMIDLNPLVIRRQSTTAPPNANLEETHNMKWYEIVDTISYLPGGVAKGEVSYKAGFYDLDYGLQTHAFAPAGVDIKALWRIGGNEPGEPEEPPELGIDTPKSGLYLREDLDLRCNIFLAGFVKKNLKKSHSKLVQDLVSKANDPRYLKTRTATEMSTPSTRSPVGSSTAESRTAFSSASISSQLSSQTPQHDTLPQQNEPCSCSGSSHHVMCHNYRYDSASQRRLSGYTHTDPRSEAQELPGSTTATTPNPADLYSPAGAHPNLAPPSARPTSYLAYQPPRDKPKQSYRFDKPLPAGPHGSTSKAPYSSPQLFGEQAELPDTIASNAQDQTASSSAAAGASELDSTEVAYWKLRQGATELE